MKREIFLICLLAPFTTNGEFKNGFYSGISAGWSRLEASQSIEQQMNSHVYYPGPWGMRNRKFKKNAFSPGIFLGYRHRKANQPWTIAVEMFLNFGRTKAEISTREPGHQNYLTANLEQNFVGGLYLKPGYIFWEKYMLFGIIGTCLDRYKWEYIEHVHPQNFQRNNKKLIPGIVFGVGVEQAITKFHVGIQTTYTLYNRKAFEGGLSRPLNNVRMNVKPKVFQVALYLSYVF